MLHGTARIVRALILGAALWMGGCRCKTPVPAGAPTPPPAAQLSVPFEQQQGCKWCWGATTVMALKTLGHPADQCSVVQKVYPHLTCCPGGVPPGMTNCSGPLKPCDSTGWPPFKKLGFRSCRTKDTALSFERLMHEIGTSSRPVLFAVEMADSNGSRSGVGHIMVAGGYKTVGGDRFVEVYDPLCPAPTSPSDPPCAYRLLSYEAYVEEKDLAGMPVYLHWDDFYEIRKK